MRGSPGMTTVAPAGGIVPSGIGITRKLLGPPMGEDGGYVPGIGCGGGGRTCGGGLNVGNGRWNVRPCSLWLVDPLLWPLHGLDARMDVKGLLKRSQHLRHG